MKILIHLISSQHSGAASGERYVLRACDQISDIVYHSIMNKSSFILLAKITFVSNCKLYDVCRLNTAALRLFKVTLTDTLLLNSFYF